MEGHSVCNLLTKSNEYGMQVASTRKSRQIDRIVRALERYGRCLLVGICQKGSNTTARAVGTTAKATILLMVLWSIDSVGIIASYGEAEL